MLLIASCFWGGLVIVRPSLLAGNHIIAAAEEDTGFSRLRVGTEKEPALGYTVPRASIGEWIYREAVKKTSGDQ